MVSTTCGSCPYAVWSARPISRLKVWSVPPSSTSALDRDRVVALEHRVEQLEQGDRLVRGHPLGEVVALEQLRHGRHAHRAGTDPPCAMSSHSPLWRISSRSSVRRTLPACSTYVRACASISSPVSTGRVAERPLGSPTRAVKSPTMSTTVWPRSWNSRSFWRTTVWPRWRSLAVGSMPSFARSGRPVARRASRAPAGSTSTALRARCAAVSAASEAGRSIRANASLPEGLVRPAGPPLGKAREDPSGVELEAGRHPTYERSRTNHRSGCRRARWRRARARPSSRCGRTASARAASRSRRAGACGSASCACCSCWSALGILAAVSTVFGMMMAVASDLPRLELRTARQLGHLRQGRQAARRPDRQPEARSS